ASAIAGTWASAKLAFLILVGGGVFIFPLTQLVLRALGRPASLPPDNPFRWLAMQVAFMVPLCLPIILFTGLALSWVYPAFMIVVGAPSLPFQFLYGQRRWLVLGIFFVVAGTLIGFSGSSFFTLGAWVAVLAFLVFATWAAWEAKRPEAATA